MPDKDFSKSGPASNPNSRHGYAAGKQSQFPRVYRIWRAMIQRTSDPNADNYARYGGKGVTVCEHWKTFANFLADMGECPSEEHSIERNDSNGDYEKSNCCWKTMAEQSRNTSHNHVLTVFGVTDCLSELCRRFNVGYDRTKARLRLGWTPEDAFTKGFYSRKLDWPTAHKIRELKGQLPTKEIAKQFGLSKCMVLLIHANKAWVAPVTEPPTAKN